MKVSSCNNRGSYKIQDHIPQNLILVEIMALIIIIIVTVVGIVIVIVAVIVMVNPTAHTQSLAACLAAAQAKQVCHPKARKNWRTAKPPIFLRAVSRV